MKGWVEFDATETYGPTEIRLRVDTIIGILERVWPDGAVACIIRDSLGRETRVKCTADSIYQRMREATQR